MNKVVNLLGTGEKQLGCALLPHNFSSRNKQSNLLTLSVCFLWLSEIAIF